MKKNWKGTYSYVYENDETEFFCFEIHATQKNGSFEGTVLEEEFYNKTGDLISVKGFIENDLISFIKTYPYAFWIDENGKPVYDKNSKGHEVIYQGYFNQNNGEWEGEWEVELETESINDENDEVKVIFGNWKMKAVL